MASAELKEVLLATPLCKYLDLHEVEMLIDFIKIVSFNTDDVLLKQGNKSEGVYIIMQGNACVSAQILSEGTYNITTLAPGNFIGEISLLQKTPSTTSVIAETPMSCVFIAKNYFDTLAIFFPETKFKLSKVITEEVCRRLKEMHQKIVSYMQHSDMVAQSFFSELMQSFSRETEITLEKAHISKEYVMKQELFSSFNEEEFNCLISNTIVMDVPSRGILLKEGDKQELVYIVLRGAVQSSIIENNVVAKLSVLGPPAILGGMLSENCKPGMISFSTCEHAILLKFSESHLAAIKQQQPKAWYKLYDLLSQSFAALEQAANRLDVRLHSELYNR